MFLEKYLYTCIYLYKISRYIKNNIFDLFTFFYLIFKFIINLNFEFIYNKDKQTIKIIYKQ